jgi:hypothetical protein
MTTHSLPSQSFRPSRPSGLGKSVRSLATGATRFIVALASVLRRPPRQKPRLTRVDEANELRGFAFNYLRTDPGFAADLMAAADRHELGSPR